MELINLQSILFRNYISENHIIVTEVSGIYTINLEMSNLNIEPLGWVTEDLNNIYFKIFESSGV